MPGGWGGLRGARLMFATVSHGMGRVAVVGPMAVAGARFCGLDGRLAGRTWVAGERFALADILLFGFLAFGAQVGQPIPDEAGNIRAWFERTKARPSAAA